MSGQRKSEFEIAFAWLLSLSRTIRLCIRADSIIHYYQTTSSLGHAERLAEDIIQQTIRNISFRSIYISFLRICIRQSS